MGESTIKTEKDAIYKIGELEENHCKGCKIKAKVKEERGSHDTQLFCMNECHIGRKIRALGGVFEYGKQANGNLLAPDLTKDKYLDLFDKKIPDKKICQMFNISKVTLNRRKKAWGLTVIKKYSVPRRKFIDRDKLEALCKTHTDKQISKILKCSTTTIVKKRKEWGITKETKKDYKKVFKLEEYKYLSKKKKLKDYEIRELWEISEGTLNNLKIFWGVAGKKKVDCEALGLTYEKVLELVPNHEDIEIAEMYKIPLMTFINHRKKLGVSPALRLPTNKIKAEDIKPLIDKGYNKTKIQKSLGIGNKTLNTLLRKYDLKM